ncbi:MAG: hypothetical protein VX938_02840 [Myxococcota bacterium]|nr:hypothetical protein [Myxococcota bacterium]
MDSITPQVDPRSDSGRAPELPQTPLEADADGTSGPETTPPACEDQCPEGSSGCQGAIVWACAPGPGGCLAPAAVEDCNAQGKVCVDPGECQFKDGEPEPEGDGIICSQFKGCMIEACGDPPSNECFNTAFNSICVPAAKTMTEVNLYLSLNGCMASNCLNNANVAAHAECITTHCLAQHAKCFAGSYGEGTCGGIDPCIAEAQCPEDDVVCARPWYEQASEDASALYWTLHLCLYGACGAEEDVKACEAGAVLEEGACHSLQSACTADGS